MGEQALELAGALLLGLVVSALLLSLYLAAAGAAAAGRRPGRIAPWSGLERPARTISRAAFSVRKSVDCGIASGGERWRWSMGFGSRRWPCWRLPPASRSAVRGSPVA